MMERIVTRDGVLAGYRDDSSDRNAYGARPASVLPPVMRRFLRGATATIATGPITALAAAILIAASFWAHSVYCPGCDVTAQIEAW